MAKTLRELARDNGFKTATSLRKALGEEVSIDTIRAHFARKHLPLPFYQKMYCDFFKVELSDIDFEVKK